jgi:HSP20 family protein
MRRHKELKVLPREESGTTSGKQAAGGHELGPVTSFERSVLSTLSEMEQMFEETIHRPFFGFNMQPIRHALQGVGSFGEFSPAVDIFDDGNEIVVKSELPGMKKEEISVDLHGNTLTISGEKKAEEKVDRKGYFRMERSHGSFRRDLSLPEGIDFGKVKADFKDGVLEVRIPKSAEKSSVRHIPIE